MHSDLHLVRLKIGHDLFETYDLRSLNLDELDELYLRFQEDIAKFNSRIASEEATPNPPLEYIARLRKVKSYLRACLNRVALFRGRLRRITFNPTEPSAPTPDTAFAKAFIAEALNRLPLDLYEDIADTARDNLKVS
jgi:hypothetical protein